MPSSNKTAANPGFGLGDPRRLGLAALFFLGAAVLAGISALREPAAEMAPLARSRLELALALARPDQAAWAEAQVRDLARRDPLHAAGFVVRGILDMRRDRQGAMRVEPLMREAIGRQPSLEEPHIWLGAFYATQHQGDRAIRQFDIALSRGDDAVQTLVPILGYLLGEVETRDLMVARLRTFPRWRQPVMQEAIAKDLLPAATLEALLGQSAPSGAAASLAGQRQAYLNRLVGKGQGLRAFQLYRGYVGAGADATLLDGSFTQATSLRPFGWSYVDEPEDFAMRTPSEGKWIARVHASGRRLLELLGQTAALAPGDWTAILLARDGGLERPDRIALVVSCLGGKELARQELGALKPEAGSVRVPFTVAPDCPLQRIALVGQDVEGSASEIEVLRMGVERR